MNILEIIWIISTVVGVVYVFKKNGEDTDFAISYVISSLICLIPYIILKYFDFITTPLW